MVDNSVVGGQTIAAGTGGIDGSDAVITAAPVVFLTNTNDATKIRYYTPSFGGFSLGVSYTPTQQDINSGAENGQFFATKDGDSAPWTPRTSSRAAAVYDGDFGGVGLLASVVGLYGELKNDAEDDVRRRQVVRRPGRRRVDLFGFKLGRQRRPRQSRRRRERNFFTAGIGAALGPVNTSLTYGQIFDTNSRVRGGDRHRRRGLQPGVLGRHRPGAGPGAGGRREQVRQRQRRCDTGTGDTGWTAVGSVRLAF